MSGQQTPHTRGASPQTSTLLNKSAKITGIFLLLLAALLFGLAGRWNWAGAWLFLGAMAACSAIDVAVLLRVNPDVLAVRLGREKGAKRWDQAVASLMTAFWVGALVVAGLDARHGWSPQLPGWLVAAGLVALVAANFFALWAMAVNKFFAKFVRIQTDRGHAAVTTGPYRYVRHPGYAAGLVFIAAQPLVLGSLWSFVPTALSLATLLVRTALEDDTLHDELPGYRAYAARVRYRLIPGVW